MPACRRKRAQTRRASAEEERGEVIAQGAGAELSLRRQDLVVPKTFPPPVEVRNSSCTDFQFHALLKSRGLSRSSCEHVASTKPPLLPEDAYVASKTCAQQYTEVD